MMMKVAVEPSESKDCEREAEEEETLSLSRSMADPFSFISESDDSAVEDIISQAIDHCVLEQISSINCSGISNSVLPSDLETRFHKLKSFPGAKPKSKFETRAKTPPPQPPLEHAQNEDSSPSLNQCENDKPLPISSPDEEVIITTQTQKTELKNPDPTTQTSSGQVINGSKHKSRSGYISSPCGLSESSSEAEGSSPPRQNCCFWYSPKKNSTKEKMKKKKKKEKWVSGIGLDPLDWDQNDEYLSDLRSFSLKEQRRKLKKALKEEEKINREAEKIVEWAKQASARIDVSAIEDLLSDDEKSD